MNELDDVQRVLETVRRVYDLGRADIADEVLAAAIERSPRNKQLRLAQLNIAYLERDFARYQALARELRARLPECVAEWKEAQRLARGLMPAAA